GRTLPMIWKLQPSLAWLVSLNQTRRPHRLPLQSVISTAPRPVWSIQMPKGLAAAAAAAALDASVIASGRMARLMTAIMALLLVRCSTRTIDGPFAGTVVSEGTAQRCSTGHIEEERRVPLSSRGRQHVALPGAGSACFP